FGSSACVAASSTVPVMTPLLCASALEQIRPNAQAEAHAHAQTGRLRLLRSIASPRGFAAVGERRICPAVARKCQRFSSYRGKEMANDKDFLKTMGFEGGLQVEKGVTPLTYAVTARRRELLNSDRSPPSGTRADIRSRPRVRPPAAGSATSGRVGEDSVPSTGSGATGPA